MKFLGLLFLMMVWNSVYSADDAKPGRTLSQALEDKKYYYSGLNEFFKETYSREIINDDLKRLEDLLYYSGINYESRMFNFDFFC